MARGAELWTLETSRGFIPDWISHFPTGGKGAGWGRGVDSRLSTMSSEKAGVERKGCRAWPDYTSVGASPHS